MNHHLPKALGALALGALVLAGCNNSPQEKIEAAQEKQVDAQVEAKEKRDDAAKIMNNSQSTTDNATTRAAQAIQEGQQKINDADQNMARVQADIDKDKVDGQTKLTQRLQDLDEKMAKLKAQPMDTDPAKQNEFNQKMALATTALEEARAKIGEYAAAPNTDWKGAYDNASAMLDKADQAIGNAD